VETASSEFCAVNSYINVSLPTGYIVAGRQSSATSSSSQGDDDGPVSATGCDHSVKPWVIAARRGQRVNLTLYDFSLAALPLSSVGSSSSAGRGRDGGGGGSGRGGDGGGGGRICRQYGWLDDSAFDRPSPLCATDRRVSAVYASRGHVVKLWTMSPPTSVSGDSDVGAAAAGKRFMIKYAGASGCLTRSQSIDVVHRLLASIKARYCVRYAACLPASDY